MALAAQGADVLDIGGESTRPGATPVSVDDEIARVVPVIERLVGGARISVDTRHAAVAEAALRAGATIVNDVSAGADQAMFALVASAGAGLVLMHMQGTPETMQAEPTYDDVCEDVASWLEERVAAAESAGIERSRLWVDPGIGFGKTLDHNLALMRGLEDFRRRFENVRVLLGASRKSFLGSLTGRRDPQERGPASLACAARAFEAGISDIRVHDVAATRDVFRVLSRIR